MNDTFDRFVDRARAVLEKDPRFVGLAIAGSWVFGEVDEFSDLDLIIVTQNDPSIDDAAVRNGVAESIGDLVSSFSGEHVGEPKLLICLYQEAQLIHVDLKFATQADFAKRTYDPRIAWQRGSILSDILSNTALMPMAPDVQWIEDRVWTWVHYGAMRLGREELFDLVGLIGFLRERVLGPLALHLGGFPPHGVRKIERYLPDFARRLQTTVPGYNAQSCYSALLASIEIYRDLRSKFSGLVVNERAEAASMLYLDQVAGLR